jgi:hypothetical protein
MKATKGSHVVKRCCEVFKIHRNNYKYWAKQTKQINPREVETLVMVKVFIFFQRSLNDVL